MKYKAREPGKATSKQIARLKGGRYEGNGDGNDNSNGNGDGNGERAGGTPALPKAKALIRDWRSQEG